jgi:hypothetical protein
VQRHSRASSLCDGGGGGEDGEYVPGSGGFSTAPSSRIGDHDDSDSDEQSPFDTSLAR